MKTSKSHNTMKVVDMKLLRRDIDLIPDDIKDKYYETYFAQKEEKLRNQQYAQMLMIRNLARTVAESDVYKSGKFLLGGRDHGMYELFYRQEPSEFLSHPQFSHIACRCFGWDINDASSVDILTKLYNTFDVKKRHTMNWRQFLYLFAILSMPDLSCRVHFQWGFAILASSGYLIEFAIKKLSTVSKESDEDTLSLKNIKILYSWALDMSAWTHITSEIDKTWANLILNDVRARKLVRQNGIENDPDNICIDKNMLKIMFDSSELFQSIDKVHEYHCYKDKSIWTYEFEMMYYHPILYAELRKIRRERRNEDSARDFNRKKLPRILAQCISRWKKFLLKKRELKFLIIKICSDLVKARQIPVIKKWKIYAIAVSKTLLIQKVVRGFIARQRVHFIRFLVNNVIKIQPLVRGFLARVQYRHLIHRRDWAVKTIQRVARGRLARLNTRSILLAKIDVERRKFEKERQNWYHRTRSRAAEIIQMCYRRYKALKRVALRIEERERITRVHYEIDQIKEDYRVQKYAHRQEIEKYYRKRKFDYESSRLREESTADHRNKVKELNRKLGKLELAERKLKASEIEKQVEELRLAAWNREWDKIAQIRAKQKEAMCRRALDNKPESQTEVNLQKTLKQKIKTQTKDVLRRADKQLIPMNLPEGQEIAREEVVKMEMQLEIDIVRREQTLDGERIREQQRRERNDKMTAEEAYKERYKHEAAISIQCLYRQWSARKEVRRRVYKLFVKHFDTSTLQYYYENLTTSSHFWTKPSWLGSYDVDCPEGWIVIEDNHGVDQNGSINVSDDNSATTVSRTVMEAPDIYFYNPKTYDQSWNQPQNTTLCDTCKRKFATVCMTKSGLPLADIKIEIEDATLYKYCESCFEINVSKLLNTEISQGSLSQMKRSEDNIILKVVAGNKPSKRPVDFTSLKDISYRNYIKESHMTKSLKSIFDQLSQEKEEQLRQAKLKRKNGIVYRQKSMGVRDRRDSGNTRRDSQTKGSITSSFHKTSRVEINPICPHCEVDEHENKEGFIIPPVKNDSVYYCKDCMSSFCNECYHSIHDGNEEFKVHRRDELMFSKQESDKEENMEQRIGSASKNRSTSPSSYDAAQNSIASSTSKPKKSVKILSEKATTLASSSKSVKGLITAENGGQKNSKSNDKIKSKSLSDNTVLVSNISDTINNNFDKDETIVDDKSDNNTKKKKKKSKTLIQDDEQSGIDSEVEPTSTEKKKKKKKSKTLTQDDEQSGVDSEVSVEKKKKKKKSKTFTQDDEQSGVDSEAEPTSVEKKKKKKKSKTLIQDDEQSGIDSES